MTAYRSTAQQWHHRNHRARDSRCAPEMADCWRCQRAVAICKTKRAFADRDVAAEAALTQNVEMGWVGAVHPYPCRHCGLYHVATAKRTEHRKRVEKQRRKWLIRSLAA